ncbi:MAG: DUF1902 domain-containing protein [Clostridiaceae bacterium]|jgi:hypothetical protein|nr:DUF1902 domain-containing protein [Clostridiaceae bacterium]
MNEYTVNFIWDSDACVWIAISDDISGLTLESGSLDALMERVRFVIPELLKLNGDIPHDISITYNTQRHERIPCNG